MIKVHEIKKSITNKKTATQILKGISFEIAQGEMVALMGPSGCGKSTLLGIIAGLDKPDSGYVAVGGIKLYDLPASKLDECRLRNISMIFQNYGLIKELNCRDNICLPLLFKNNGGHKNEKMVIEKLGMNKFLDHFPAELSGGEQQRIAISRALMNEPKIILADEPTGSLDQKNGGKIMTIFRDAVTKNNRTVLIVTHDKTVADLCDRTIYMEDGHLL